ncbi:hypothetical protein GCM10009799_14420 [Nocardiopsis rhodophaea]|uniref:Uncharacterized protein n=1 Tax=Nocardiopsis rhodophaea TaxID=280238 RepID=A0ABN2SND7_9ACTN
MGIPLGSGNGAAVISHLCQRLVLLAIRRLKGPVPYMLSGELDLGERLSSLVAKGPFGDKVLRAGIVPKLGSGGDRQGVECNLGSSEIE